MRRVKMLSLELSDMGDPITDEDHADRVIMELDAEVKRLRAFILALANRIADSSDVLGKLAEKPSRRKE